MKNETVSSTSSNFLSISTRRLARSIIFSAEMVGGVVLVISGMRGAAPQFLETFAYKVASLDEFMNIWMYVMGFIIFIAYLGYFNMKTRSRLEQTEQEKRWEDRAASILEPVFSFFVGYVLGSAIGEYAYYRSHGYMPDEIPYVLLTAGGVLVYHACASLLPWAPRIKMTIHLFTFIIAIMAMGSIIKYK